MSRLVRFIVLLSLFAVSAAQPSRSRNQRNRGSRGKRARRNCRLPGCLRCNVANQSECDACRPGWAKTEENQCGVCGDSCKQCDQNGPGSCDVCKPGFTLEPVARECRACSPHCLQCDEAGPGKCNECGARRMLHARLELDGEVHECLPCGDGCKECTFEEGCTRCESFHYALPNGAGCAFSYTKMFIIIAIVILGIIGCACALDSSVDTQYHGYQPTPRPRDVAKPVKRTSDAPSGLLRQRSSGRAENSPPREPVSAYPGSLVPNYSGIEIVKDYS